MSIFCICWLVDAVLIIL